MTKSQWKRIQLLLFALLIAGLCIAAFYKPSTNIVRVHAVVLDDKHHPIQSAILVITNEDGSPLRWYVPRSGVQPITNKTGHVQEEVPNPDIYVVEACANGYKSSKQTIDIQLGGPEATFILEKE